MPAAVVPTRSASAGRSVESDQIEVVLSHLDRLPTLPAVAAKLLRLTTSDTSCAQDVVAVLETDPSLTAMLLGMARRTDHGLRVEQLTVSRIVALLGFQRVRNAVLSVQIHSILNDSHDEQRAAQIRQDIWKHSLAVACVADMLTKHVRGADLLGDAFICGLLHDIGKTALDAAMPKSYMRIISRVQKQRICICDAERDVFGIDHMVAGKRLAVRWNLPQVVIECIRMHHQDHATLPSSLTNPEMVRLIQTADRIVRRQHVGFSGYRDTDHVAALLHHWSIGETVVDQIVEQLPDRMADYSQLIGIDDEQGRSLYAQSVAKANVELGNINAQLFTSKQQLDRAQACMRAVGVLTHDVVHDSTLTDACYATARATLEMHATGDVFVFIMNEGSCTIYTASVSSSGEDLAAQIIPAVGQEFSVLCKEFEQLAHQGPPVSAKEPFVSLWRSAGFTGNSDAVCILPIYDHKTPIGAVLLQADGDRSISWSSGTAEWQTLAKAAGLAVAMVRSRIAVECNNDELLDLNRRLHVTQRDLVRSRSIAMVSEMAAGAAHELNNPLSVISARSQMSLQQCSDPVQAQVWQTLIEQTNNAAEIVTDLMAFAKPGPPQASSLLLRSLLNTLSQHWETQLDLKSSQLVVSLDNPDATVFADANHLQQVLTALVENAMFATNAKSRQLKINSPSSASDETVRIVIEDNGVGMSAAVLEHAVDPFFSFREAGRGRGLGLSLAHRLVGHNGGELWIASSPQTGTTVTIELPARPTHCS